MRRRFPWPSGSRGPASAGAGVASQDVDPARLLPDVHRGHAPQRGEVDHLHRARLGAHPFHGDEGVAVVRRDGEDLRPAADLRSVNAEVEVLIREALSARGVKLKAPEIRKRGRPKKED